MTRSQAHAGPHGYPDAFILLTGGAGRRLGGADKASIDVGGMTLFDRAVSATAGRPVIVVGPPPRTEAAVVVTRENPPGGGPAAGVAAGVAALGPDQQDPVPPGLLVAVQAIDQVGVTPDTWRRLATAARDASGGAILVGGGRRQYGAGVFPLPLLRHTCAQRLSWHGRPLRELLDPIVAALVQALGDESRDIDTLEDLTWWRSHAEAPDDVTDGVGSEGEPR
jgi:molybdopterin-guanine dinucleotide biosynthesis protein A